MAEIASPDATDRFVSADVYEGLTSLLHSVASTVELDDPNCVGQDTEMFFPDKGGSTTAAKFICSRCTVLDDCLRNEMFAEAKGHGRFGVYGGLSEKERRLVIKEIEENGPAAGNKLIGELRTKGFERAQMHYRSKAGIKISLGNKGEVDTEDVLSGDDNAQSVAS